LTGYTPYPQLAVDDRLPHIAVKVHKQIEKTALGAELSVTWSHHEDVFGVLSHIKNDGYEICAVEQASYSIQLPGFEPSQKVALLVGREVEGVEQKVLTDCNKVLEIPMFGSKESFNVVQAAAMALYHCRFYIAS
jgi:23S rRNA (guanosine2251-2'-O)-methyltransferase